MCIHHGTMGYTLFLRVAGLFCIDSLILEWMPSFKSLIKHFCRTRNGLSVYSHDRILCFERVRCSVKRHSTQNSQFHLSKQMGSKLTVCVWNALKWALSKGFWANFRRNNIVFAQLNANAVCSDLIKALFIEDFQRFRFKDSFSIVFNMLVTAIVSFFMSHACMHFSSFHCNSIVAIWCFKWISNWNWFG